MQKFKDGDLVYDLRQDGIIYEVVDNPSTHTQYKLVIVDGNGKYHTYTETGLFSADDTLPALVKATEENREALVSIFGDVFQKLEDYKNAPTSADIIKELINKQGFAWCGVSDYSEDEAREQAEYTLRKIVKVVEGENGYIEFYINGNTGFYYAVPFDLNTGDEITNLLK